MNDKIFFSSGLQQKSRVFFSQHLLLWYSDHPLRQESTAVIETEPYAKEAAGVAAHQCSASERLAEWDKVMSVPLDRWAVSG